MRKISKIKLHDLSQAEMADRELNLLRGGGSGVQCACATVCMPTSCVCKEHGDSGLYPLADSNAVNNDDDVAESSVSGVAQDNHDTKNS